MRNADKWFSIFIRLRDASFGGMVRCITCGNFKFWKSGDLDCGHYQKRGNFATRYDERNCAAQCRKCNRYHSGRDDIFAIRIDERHGPGTAERLRILAGQKGGKWTKLDFELKAAEYREKAKSIAGNRGVEL